MRVFCLKGSTFCNEHISGTKKSYLVLHSNKHQLKEQKYLISSLDNPYIEIRQRELRNLAGDLSNGITLSINHLQHEEDNNSSGIEFRLHKETVRFRLYIFDENLYLSYQPSDSKGSECPMQKYPKDSSGYRALESYFEELWKTYEKEGNKV